MKKMGLTTNGKAALATAPVALFATEVLTHGGTIGFALAAASTFVAARHGGDIRDAGSRLLRGLIATDSEQEGEEGYPTDEEVAAHAREHGLDLDDNQPGPMPFSFEDVEDEIPAGKTLLGMYPDTGELAFTGWEKFKCLWIVGTSSTGKSNTIYGKALEAVNDGAKLLVVDQHAAKEDSLTRKLLPLKDAFLGGKVSVKDEEVLSAIRRYKAEFERRVDGAPCEQKIVLICDEMNRMARNEKLLPVLKDIVAVCGEESRGFGMYGWFLSQKAVHLKWLRDSAITVIVHQLTRIEEAKLACNDDLKAARQCLKFPVGRTFVYGVDFDLMELQQALYEARKEQVREDWDTYDDWDEDVDIPYVDDDDPLAGMAFSPEKVDTAKSTRIENGPDEAEEVMPEASKVDKRRTADQIDLKAAISLWNAGYNSRRKLAAILDISPNQATKLIDAMGVNEEE